MRKGLTFFISIFPFLSTAFTADAQTVEFYTPRTVVRFPTVSAY